MDIAVGDLVCVVRANPCGCPDRLGLHFTAAKIAPSGSHGYCAMCLKHWLNMATIIAVYGHPSGSVWINRLRRIDPPPLEESRTGEAVAS